MITVKCLVKAQIDKVWDAWVNPTHIVNWYFASDEWHAPKAENDLKVGGSFKTRMEAKDGSFGFDLEGEYLKIEKHKQIDYIMPDDRKVSTTFEMQKEEVLVTQKFDPENSNPHEMQKNGWQAILNNFKKYVESLK